MYDIYIYYDTAYYHKIKEIVKFTNIKGTYYILNYLFKPSLFYDNTCFNKYKSKWLVSKS